jgi:hypothetical protein
MLTAVFCLVACRFLHYLDLINHEVGYAQRIIEPQLSQLNTLTARGAIQTANNHTTVGELRQIIFVGTIRKGKGHLEFVTR